MLIPSNETSANKAHILFVSDGSRGDATIRDGWVRLTDSKGAPLFRPVYLVSESDLLNCIRILEDFARPGFTDPVGLVEIWKQAIQTAAGTLPAGPEEYLSIATGLSFRSLSPFLSRKFDDLQKATTDEIAAFLTAAKNGVERLQRLRANKSLWFTNYGEDLAWIPAGDLP
jgi:hypothetical protein